MESRKRSLIKTFTWRAIAFSVTLIVAYVFIGELTLSLSVAVISGVIKTLTYYAHERAWVNLKRGMVKKYWSTYIYPLLLLLVMTISALCLVFVK